MGQELVALQAKLAEQALEIVKLAPSTEGMQILSTRAGQLSFNGNALPGNQVCVVIADFVFANAYYAEKFDPNNKVPPTCYAFARKSPELAPHPSMADHLDYFRPQHEECRGCPQNEFGTADTGRGKACKNGVRLTLIPAGYYDVPKKGSRDCGEANLYTDPQDIGVDFIYLNLPPTSARDEWWPYVAQLSAGHRTAPHGVVTRIYLEPHEKNQFHVKFEMVEKVSDELLGVVMERHEEARNAVIPGYQPPEKNETAAQPGGLRNLRRH